MNADDYTIGRVFEGPRRFTMGHHQREYVWDAEKQWQPLWNELQEMALEHGANGSDYYLGAIVLQAMEAQGLRPPEFQVIDGQQRLTTLQVLFSALRDVCHELGEAALQSRVEAMTDNANEQGVDGFKVWPTDADQVVFRMVMRFDQRQNVLGQYPLRQYRRRTLPRPRLVEAYEFFHDAITEYATRDEQNAGLQPDETHRRLERLIIAIRNRVKVVWIQLNRDDDPLMIFESLNGRSTPLLASDLIKNFVLRKVPPADADRLYDQYWRQFDTQVENGQKFWKSSQRQGRQTRPRIDLFLMHYVQCYYAEEIQIPDLFKMFRKWWESRQNEPHENLLRELVGYSQAYRGMIAPADDDTDEGWFFRNLQSMDITLVYPLLLFLLKDARDQQRVVEAEVPGMLQDLESYLVRRHICDLTKKKYNHVFPAILKNLRQAIGEQRSVDRALLREVLLNFQGESVEWPDDARFSRAWLETPIYDLKPTGFVKVILSRIEAKLRLRYPEPVVVRYSDMTIEHLMPNGWREHYPLPINAQPSQYRGEPETAEERHERLIDSIGNLTLMGQELNTANSNRPWAEKRELIRQFGALRMNSDVTNKDSWDEAAITNRANQLLLHAIELWPYPAPGGVPDDPVQHFAAAPPPQPAPHEAPANIPNAPPVEDDANAAQNGRYVRSENGDEPKLAFHGPDYVHRIPLEAVLAVAHSVADQFEDGWFRSTEITRLLGHPVYFTRHALNWLESLGLIEQNGRRGLYRWLNAELNDQWLQEQFELLPRE